MVADDHYIHKSQITPFQKAKVEELRSACKFDLDRYPEYDTDFSLLRWLMGWDYKIDVIIPKLKYAIDTLVNLGMAKQPTKSCEEINNTIRNLSTVAEYFPGGLMGTTDDGEVIYMQAMAKTHPKSLIKSGSSSELYKLCLMETEFAFKLVREAENRTDKKLGVMICMDLEGFNMDLLYTPALKVYLNLLTLLQNIFPDFARKIFIMNCPMMMSTVYSMVSPVLSAQTRAKVKFLGTDWKISLIKELGEKNIYSHWGGSKKHPSPTGDIRMGGKVPEKLWYNDNHRLESDREKLSISARSKAEVTLYGETGKTFHWLWRVSSGDIDFSIKKDGKLVWPVFRIATEFHPELGKLEIEENGEYTFVFDNSHGKLFGKDVKYKIVSE